MSTERYAKALLALVTQLEKDDEPFQRIEVNIVRPRRQGDKRYIGTFYGSVALSEEVCVDE